MAVLFLAATLMMFVRGWLGLRPRAVPWPFAFTLLLPLDGHIQRFPADVATPHLQPPQSLS